MSLQGLSTLGALTVCVWRHHDGTWISQEGLVSCTFVWGLGSHCESLRQSAHLRLAGDPGACGGRPGGVG